MSDAPRATDLFLQLWCFAMASEEGLQPGTPEWGATRRASHAAWARTWLDCVALSKHLERCSALAAQAVEVSSSGDAPNLDNGNAER